jgi:hypothetical protein
MNLKDNRLKIEQLKHRWLYRLLARNIKIGVWDADHQEFLGIRTKFGDRYIDSENHWDAEHFATACPMEEIGELPDNISLSEENELLFNWLEIQEKNCLKG